MEFGIKTDTITFSWEEVIVLGARLSIQVIEGTRSLPDLEPTEREIFEFYCKQIPRLYGPKVKQHYNKEDYQQYLESAHWLRFRLLALDHYTYKCMVCGGLNKPLDVHHNNYDCLGHETFNDVIAVCHDCHEKIHKA